MAARKPLTEEEKARKAAEAKRRQDEIPLPGEEKRKVARPYKSPQILFGRMEDYFEACKLEADGAGVFPDEAGMRIFLKLSHESYNAYREDPAYQKVFDWAQDMRESWLARRLALEPKMAQAYLNALKQPANGGWVDRRADTGDKTLKLKIDGVGGEAAFQ